MKPFNDKEASANNGQTLCDAHVERNGEFARTISAWARACARLDETIGTSPEALKALAAEVAIQADRLRLLFVRELAARGEYVGSNEGAEEPALEFSRSFIAALFAALSGRRRDAELGGIKS